MNIQTNPRQSDTKLGLIQLTASADLTGKENLVLKVVNTAGVPQFALPSSIADITPYICASGDVAANTTSAEAPDLGGNARVAINGTVVAGDKLVHDATSYGKLIKLPATAGIYYSPGIAEESGAAGGDVKFRPLPRMISVAPTPTAVNNTTATPTDTASLITSVNALKVQGNALVVDLAALAANNG